MPEPGIDESRALSHWYFLEAVLWKTPSQRSKKYGGNPLAGVCDKTHGIQPFTQWELRGV